MAPARGESTPSDFKLMHYREPLMATSRVQAGEPDWEVSGTGNRNRPFHRGRSTPPEPGPMDSLRHGKANQ